MNALLCIGGTPFMSAVWNMAVRVADITDISAQNFPLERVAYE